MIRRLALLLLVVGCVMSPAGCARKAGPLSADASITLTGTLTAVRDDRPSDGGIALTLEVAPGTFEVVLVPSLFRAAPAPELDRIRLMHQVVDAITLGDRVRATCQRDPGGSLIAESLEIAFP